ncbi:hypothetical protein AQUCO_01600347v1 [Aquilegia coerulea]|uniref:Protein FAM33A n=1 Tax=Aquilegia coerulea TaxID=218851 RepID=A0A2G5DRG0_AQUCA|nr:hypothetical protein AQUCO_01600347v1 [Aquilegia coerulea]PIA46016.1 hypothetical protein AQUCO_01600347v1 [Aquilegia coerulea]
MSHRYQHNPAMDDLENLLNKANHDLTLVHNKLHKEFQTIYPDNANPLKLVTRIKKIQEDLASTKVQCRELLSAKQDLIDKASTVLIGNRSLVQRMQASSGIPTSTDSDDPAYTNLKQIIDEWTLQFRSQTGGEKHDFDSEDINQLLFSAVVKGN